MKTILIKLITSTGTNTVFVGGTWVRVRVLDLIIIIFGDFLKINWRGDGAHRGVEASVAKNQSVMIQLYCITLPLHEVQIFPTQVYPLEELRQALQAVLGIRDILVRIRTSD